MTASRMRATTPATSRVRSASAYACNLAICAFSAAMVGPVLFVAMEVFIRGWSGLRAHSGMRASRPGSGGEPTSWHRPLGVACAHSELLASVLGSCSPAALASFPAALRTG